MGEYGCGQTAAVEPDEEKPDEEKQRA